MTDCKPLPVEEAPQETDTDIDQSIFEDEIVDSSCWLMKPVSPISISNTSETVTDQQSSSDSFCLICDKVCRSRFVALRNSSNSNDLVGRLHQSKSNSSADKSPVIRAAAGENNRITVYVKSPDEDTQHDAKPFDKLSLLRRNKPRSLGVFRSAIIRQLWEIHRLLLALVQETSTLKKRRDSVVDGWRGRSLSAVEMPLDSTSATSTNNILEHKNQPVQTGATQPPQPQQSQMRHSRPTPTFSKQQLSDQIQQKRQQLCPIVLGRQPSTVTSRSPSICSFACAQASGKQLCFASTVCIGPIPNPGAAKQVKAESRTPQSGDTMDSASESGMTLLSRRFVYKINHSSTATISTSDTVRLAASARLGSASILRSNSSSSFISKKKVRDVIVFQRALHDNAVTNNTSEKRQKIVATLSRLKLRIDAIKLNLESLPSEVVVMKSAKSRNKRPRSMGWAARNENNIWPYYLYRPNRFETRKIWD